MKSDAELIAALAETFDVPQQERSLMQDKPWLLLEDTKAGMVLLARVDPCDLRPAAGATRFNFVAKVGKKHCEDDAAAQKIVNQYEDLRLDDPQEAKKLTAADLYNVACAYLWRKKGVDASAEKAYDLLKQALKRANANEETQKQIADTVKRFEPITPGVPLARLRGKLSNASHVLDDVRAWMIEKADLG